MFFLNVDYHILVEQLNKENSVTMIYNIFSFDFFTPFLLVFFIQFHYILLEKNNIKHELKIVNSGLK